MKITKGVIAAAGRGTRFLPAVKAVPKELLPIVDKPIIQYIVEEFVASGIKDIVIVTAAAGGLIEQYFSPSPELEDYLEKVGKAEELGKIRELSAMARFTFVRQKAGPYGNGTACLSARAAVGGEPFMFAFGDDLVLSQAPFTAAMLAQYEKRPGIYLGVQEVAAEEVVKYGVVDPDPAELGRVRGMVEKPPAPESPSRLAVFGRYLLPPEIFGALEKIALGKAGELWLLDAVQDLISQGVLAYYQKVEDGRWYTTGDPATYLAAVRAFALARPEYATKLKNVFIQ